MFEVLTLINLKKSNCVDFTREKKRENLKKQGELEFWWKGFLFFGFLFLHPSWCKMGNCNASIAEDDLDFNKVADNLTVTLVLGNKTWQQNQETPWADSNEIGIKD